MTDPVVEQSPAPKEIERAIPHPPSIGGSRTFEEFEALARAHDPECPEYAARLEAEAAARAAAHAASPVGKARAAAEADQAAAKLAV